MAGEIKMLPIKQKQIVELIITAGFKKSDFKFLPIDNLRFELFYIPNRFYHFRVDANLNYMGVPGANGNLDFKGTMRDWEHLAKATGVWLGNLKENIEIGNPWEEIESIKNEMNNLNFDSYEEFFNENEQNKISEKLDLLLIEIGKLNIDTTEIKRDIDHLKTMSDKISKKDFVLLFLGVITSWIFNAVVTPEHTSAVWGYIKSLFSGFNLKLLS